MQFQVAATALHLRSEPRVTNTNGLAVLPYGHRVDTRPTGEGPWKLANTVLGGTSVTGYVHGAYLKKASRVSSFNHVAPIHLRENRPEVRPSSTSGRAFPIGDPSRPVESTIDVEARLAHLASVIAYLDVERSPRYKSRGTTTYCNIYAYDYCYLANTYLPRVWWKDKALESLGRGESVAPRYDATLRELRANDLYDWFTDYAEQFGWTRCFDVDQLQSRANAGAVGVIVAQQAQLGRPGHIAVVAPETDGHEAARRKGKVVRPLQSQAGRVNRQYTRGSRAWWQYSSFRAFGFWTSS